MSAGRFSTSSAGRSPTRSSKSGRRTGTGATTTNATTPRLRWIHASRGGEILTDAEGRYGFKTIVPGPYAAGPGGGMRTPHIHFRVARRGYHELITQMYFDGQELNPQDALWTGLSQDERSLVTIALEPGPEDSEFGARLARFDIVLRLV